MLTLVSSKTEISFSHYRTDLSSTLKKLKENKKDFKRNISEIEVRSKCEEEELSTAEVYVEYKATKCKIKLIKALLDKHSI